MKRTVLVTGVAGFMGSHVADECLAQGFQVIGVDDLSGGYRENVPAGVVFEPCSVLDEAQIEEKFDRYKPSLVFHLAAYAAEVLSPHIRVFNYQNNVVGSMVLINAALRHRVERFVFTSSAAVYGHGDRIWTEQDVPCPGDPYGVAKLTVEMDLRLARGQGLPYTIVRPHNVYGPRQNVWDRYRNVVGIFMRQAATGQPLTVYGDGSQVRQFCYVKDVVEAMVAMAQSPEAEGQTYNVGTNCSVSVLQLAQQVVDLFSKGEYVPAIQHLESRNEAAIVRVSHVRAHHAGYCANPVPLETGLLATAAWLLTQPERPLVKKMQIEVPEGLPANWK